MMTLQAIKWDKERGSLEILDQKLLPAIDCYIPILSVHDGWDAINNMQVRGAPAIAIVGCLSLAVDIIQRLHKYEEKTDFRHYIQDTLYYLISARPTAVNMKTAANNLINLANNLCEDVTYTISDMKNKIIDAIDAMMQKDINDNKSIGNFGACHILQHNVLNNSSIQILTHCNTGSLATAGYGTALGVIRSLYDMGKHVHVYCTETRPYNQGARLTAYELVHDNIPASLICDDMVAAVFKTRQITAVIVGADRVVMNGDTANKIGTYQIAILAKYHNIPFYVAAPVTSIDFAICNGDQIVIEERPEEEMTHINNKRIAAEGIKCWNPAFDVTPANLITGIITEFGVFSPTELINVKKYKNNEHKK